MNIQNQNQNFHSKELKCLKDIGPIKEGEHVYCFRDVDYENKFHIYTAREVYGVNQVTIPKSCKDHFKIVR